MTNKSLIINTDDLGYYPGATRGILEAAERGIVTSATLLVNMPGSEEAAKQAVERKLSLGLHFNLTHGRPVCEPGKIFSLVDSEGSFFLTREEIELKCLPEHIEMELNAQLDRFKTLTGKPPSHMDGHKHIHRFQKVLDVMVQSAKICKLPIRSSSAQIAETVKKESVLTTDYFIGDVSKEPFWTKEKLLQALRSLQPGVTELMCHPGYYDKTGEPLGFYNRQRETELFALCDEEVKECVKTEKIRLITFACLK